MKAFKYLTIFLITIFLMSCKKDDSNPTTPNSPPTASFIIEPISGELSTIFTVDASGSSDDNTTNSNLHVRWKWETSSDFTDWTTSKTATHQYSNTDTKKITLEVKDEEGATGSAEATVTVVEQFKPPIACFSISPLAGSPITEITLEASCSKDPNNPPQSLQYRWDFESDGTWDEIFSAAKTVKHKFSQKNSTVTITLEAKNTTGFSSITTKDIKIGEFEGFENGIPLGWTNGGNYSWMLSTQVKHSGNYSTKAGSYLLPGQKSSLEVKVTGPIIIRFWLVKGGAFNDISFKFLDGTNSLLFLDYGSETYYWTEYMYTIPNGDHTLTWLCECNDTGSDNFLYLDDVEFIPVVQ